MFVTLCFPLETEKNAENGEDPPKIGAENRQKMPKVIFHTCNQC